MQIVRQLGLVYGNNLLGGQRIFLAFDIVFATIRVIAGRLTWTHVPQDLSPRDRNELKSVPHWNSPMR